MSNTMGKELAWMPVGFVGLAAALCGSALFGSAFGDFPLPFELPPIEAPTDTLGGLGRAITGVLLMLAGATAINIGARPRGSGI